MRGCAMCGWPSRPERSPADDCPLFGDPDHDSLHCHDCWGICDELCVGCGRPVRTPHRTADTDGLDALAAAPIGRDQIGDAGAHDDTRIEGQA